MPLWEAAMIRIVLMGLLAVGCCSPVRYLRSITELRQCNDASYDAKMLLRECENATILKQSSVSRAYSRPLPEVALIAKELRKIDKQFKIEILPDSNHIVLVVSWKK